MTPEEQARDFADRCGWAAKTPGFRYIHTDDLVKAFLAYRDELLAQPRPEQIEKVRSADSREGLAAALDGIDPMILAQAGIV